MLKKSKENRRILLDRILLLLVFTTFASCDESEESGDIFISADPPSVFQGSETNVKLKTSESFFENEMSKPLKSGKNLLLKKIKRIDSNKAIATFVSYQDTEIGIHDFVIDMGSKKAELSVSVLAKESGPGKVTIERNVGSSGVELSYFTILGEGTSFDKWCTAEVHGAEGFKIVLLSVENVNKMNVYYSIDLDQAPKNIIINLIDGEYRYDIPFTIVKHKTYENAIKDQVLTKGQLGKIRLFQDKATLNNSTVLTVDNDEKVEIGRPYCEESGVWTIPVRVNKNYSKKSIDLIAKTFTDGHSFLEMMPLTVDILEPAYLAIKNARLSSIKGETERVFVVKGMDAYQINEISVKGEEENVAITDWRPESEKVGSMSLYLKDNFDTKAYTIVANTFEEQRLYSVVLVSNSETERASTPDIEYVAGDSFYLPVMVQSGGLEKESIAIQNNEDVKVKGYNIIDKYTLVAEVELSKSIVPGKKRFVIESKEENYDIYLRVIPEFM